MITAEQWYEQNPERKNYYQGDVLSEIPFPILPTFATAVKQDAWGILRPRPNRNRPENRSNAEIMRNLPNDLIGRAAKDVVDVWSDPEGEHIMAHCRKKTVMLVSRSCDVDKLGRKHFLVSPVIAIHTLPDAQKTDDKLRDIRANNIFHWFYLPAIGDLPESFADLSVMTPLHRTFFDVELLQANLLVRLSAKGTSAFQVALSKFYGTNFGFAPPDSVPQAGRFACSACFFAGNPSPTVKELATGDFFGDCPDCGEEAMWIKFPDQAEGAD